jgi:hypothetical protein
VVAAIHSLCRVHQARRNHATGDLRANRGSDTCEGMVGRIMSKPGPCNCGSGKTPTWVYDADNIPLCLACENCYQEKLSRYRKDILTVSSRHYGEQVDDNY